MGAASIVRASVATVACSRRCRGSQVFSCSSVLLTRLSAPRAEKRRLDVQGPVFQTLGQARQLHTHPLFEAAVGISVGGMQQKERRAGMQCGQRQR